MSELTERARVLADHYSWSRGQEAVKLLRELADALEQAESNKGPLLKRHQPCGCVVCYCEGDQCLGCGAKFCGTHPVGQMPERVYEPALEQAPTRAEIRSAYVEIQNAVRDIPQNGLLAMRIFEILGNLLPTPDPADAAEKA